MTFVIQDSYKTTETVRPRAYLFVLPYDLVDLSQVCSSLVPKVTVSLELGFT